MTVERILASKGRDVATISGDRTMAEAARDLTTRKIGALVVSDDGRSVLGILSERDIVRVVAERGADVLGEPIHRHMTHRVITCTREAAVHEVMEMMTGGKFRHLPIVENGELVGLVSIGDVVKHRLAEVEAEHKALREYIAMA